MTNNITLQSNNAGLQAILNTINDLPNAGSSDPVLQDKTVTPSTSSQTITADSNYDGLSKVTVNAMPTATQATPSISINSNGLITASATQTAGYVVGGTKSATKQLAFQPAKTITPSATSQIAVSSGYYTGGNITVAGDSNLVAGNIKSGVSIFGVNGNYVGSGGDTSIEDGLVARTLTSYTNDRIKTLGSSVFASCSSLTAVSFPVCEIIYGSAFANCSNLTTVSFPACTSIYGYVFASCSRLTTVSFPACTSINNYAFYRCSRLTTVSFPVLKTIGNEAFTSCSLTTVSFPMCTNIYNNAFYNCNKLTTVYLTASSVCTLNNSRAFLNTGITSSTGSIFVKSSLVASYKAATNWTYFSNRIYGV